MGRRRRSAGTDLRTLGMSPRDLATNPRAVAGRDGGAVANLKTRALFALHIEGRYWHEACSDTGWVTCTDNRHSAQPCGCRPITSRQAAAVLASVEHTPTVAFIRRWEATTFR